MSALDEKQPQTWLACCRASKREGIVTPGEPREALQALLTHVHAQQVQVRDVVRLSGGASRETWSFVADTPDGSTPLILRRDPPGRPGIEGSMALEANAMRAS